MKSMKKIVPKMNFNISSDSSFHDEQNQSTYARKDAHLAICPMKTNPVNYAETTV